MRVEGEVKAKAKIKARGWRVEGEVKVKAKVEAER